MPELEKKKKKKRIKNNNVWRMLRNKAEVKLGIVKNDRESHFRFEIERDKKRGVATKNKRK